MTYAPVVIPTLNRFSHFQRCLESLERCTGADKTDVFIGLDFPPTEKYRNGWEKTDQYLRQKMAKHKFGKLEVFRREQNFGLRGEYSNFNQLIQFVLQQYDSFIFSEDDNEFAPNFLEYMNKNLEAYKDDPDIIAVCGYSYPIKWAVSKSATCLKENVSVPMFGIGFWKDKRLAYVNELANGRILNSLKETVRNGKYRKMIDAGKLGYFEATCRSIFLKRREDNSYCRSSDFTLRTYMAIADKYVISPVISKSRNHGFDGSGTCCQLISDTSGNTSRDYDYANQPIDTSDTFEFIPDTLQADDENRIRMDKFDCRTPQEMAKTNRLIWLCENVGTWAAKAYCLLSLPFETMSYLRKKLK